MLPMLAMVVLASAWLVPNHYYPWNSFYNESCAAVAVLLLTVGLGRHWFRSRLPVAVWVGLAVASVPAIQWAAGRIYLSGDAWVSSLYVAGLAAAIGAGFVWGRTDRPNSMLGLSSAMLAGGLASSAIAVAQCLEVGLSGIWVMDYSRGMRGYANLGQANNLATLLGMGCAGLVYLVEASKVRGGLAIGAALVMIVAAGTTQSRAACLYGPIVLAGLLLARRRDVPLRTSAAVVGTLSVAHWLITWYWPVLQQVALLAGTESLAQRGSQSLRFAIWPMMVAAANLSPWSGYGWLQVGEAHLAVANDFPGTSELWLHAHNLFLDLLLWCGYPLGLLLTGLLLVWWVSRWKSASTLDAVIGMIVVTIFGWHAMVELPHHYAYFLVPVGLWAGVVESDLVPARRAGFALPSALNLLPGAISLVMMLAIWKDYSAVEEDYRLIRFENLAIGTLRASTPAPDAPFMSAQTTFLRLARTAPKAGMAAEVLADMEAITKRYPYGRAMANLGKAWALNGRLPDGLAIYEKIRRLHGPALYSQLKNDVRLAVEAGDAGLKPLLSGLPD